MVHALSTATCVNVVTRLILNQHNRTRLCSVQVQLLSVYSFHFVLSVIAQNSSFSSQFSLCPTSLLSSQRRLTEDVLRQVVQRVAAPPLPALPVVSAAPVPPRQPVSCRDNQLPSA